jgi:tetratricopeptide (TPR) repeat protein
MPEYLATGRSPLGRKVTERIEADSADEATRILLERGFDQIVLHTDDAGSLYSGQSEVADAISPRQYLWFRALPAPLAGFLVVTINLYRRNLVASLLLIAVFGYRRYSGIPWGLLDTFTLLLFALPMLWALVAQFFGGLAAAYDRFIEDFAWGRWEQVLLVDQEDLRGVPPEEVAFRRAAALASLGQIDEAMAEVEPFSGGESTPEWLYRSRLADIHIAAHQYNEAIATTERARDLAPDNATILLDLARMEIWYRRDPHRARRYLAEAREHALSDMLQPFATFVEGMILLEENEPRAARPLLESAFKGASRFRHASPLMGYMLDQMHVGLALAFAAEGDMDEARKHYRLAKPRLVALKQTDELTRCEEAIGPLHQA